MALCLQLLVICASCKQFLVTFLIFFHQVYATSINIPTKDADGQFISDLSGNGRPNNNNRMPPSAFQDGRLKLLLHAFITKLSEEMRSDPEIGMNPKQSEFLLHRLRGLYNHLKDHPALMDSRLSVGRPLELPPEVSVAGVRSDAAITDNNSDDFARIIRKRKLELPLTEACPSVTEWLSLNKSRDIHDEEVEVFQPQGDPGSDEESQLGAQYFYTTRCINGVENEPCVGSSSFYTSRCVTRKGYVMALVRKKPTELFDWNWIQVAVSCNCGVRKKF
ncbi:uncharacterized protein LOC129586378 isoform X2 [Paramacrobiotus metropolitanus]|uniref:uncharacterized protein LOC129586378 isoform X2 n=1 Tax=Paramacrobiotus metropolitanus TaxID=2943436 RepID=UPI00244569A0|nr:uncharacterized protein LOC129586378 isoform X2 [Paramacrobiotus metropolitanus]